MASPAPVHSLGPTCAYYQEPVTASDEPPSLRARFFYTSVLPIDDPLSPLPPLSDSKTANQPPRPFSARDNAALEEAWQTKHKVEPTTSWSARHGDIFHFPKFKGQKPTPDSSIEAQYNSLEKQPSSQGEKNHADKGMAVDSKKQNSQDHEQEPEDVKHTQMLKVADSKQNTDSKHNQQIENTHQAPQPIATELPAASTPAKPAYITGRGPIDMDEEPVMLSQGTDHEETASVIPVDASEIAGEQEVRQQDKPCRRRKFAPFRNRAKGMFSTCHDVDERSDGPSSDTSGRPFARIPSFRRHPPSAMDGADSATESERSPSPARPSKENQIFVPVGASRLHLVEMPMMLMKPIYWNPINDISNVVRGMWFYQDSMLPVEQEVAVHLEAGYEAMRPWTEVWQEELDAIVVSGAADAELRAMHKLWPEEEPSRPTTAIDGSSHRAVDGSFGTDHPNSSEEKSFEIARPYRKCSVIYLNAKEAQILKPSLLPSSTRGRKPLGSVRKGRQIGIAVVRGFSQTTWDKLQGHQMSARAVKAQAGASMNQSGDATTAENRAFCAACELDKPRLPSVSDLVLVVHGIGQKLSERVDSYHFTHSINSFRREVNVEKAAQATRGALGAENSGIMVLPVNWRLTVSLDDETNSKEQHENDFSLKDITPDSLPTIRNLISDVMLDVPYYLSHHKEKMTSAVISEANRVYRLWCSNNPGFPSHGKVHLIAHSLGSVMATDILSKQPTTIPKLTDLKTSSRNPSNKALEFNTSSLFNCGSPAGLFLLLNKANLVPRKGRKGAEEAGQGVAGEASYGCLAVDNVYNIVHRNDPIAYQQNACVDAEYARSLLPAYIPGASTGFFKKIGSAVWWPSSSPSTAYQSKDGQQRPSIQHRPSTVEMETHDFSREDIAEKRMFLLNDNGQIDFFLSPGGIQYLDMLGAHSSYWISQDFVKFLVMELGREQGKEGTLPVLRAQKNREWKKGTIS